MTLPQDEHERDTLAVKRYFDSKAGSCCAADGARPPLAARNGNVKHGRGRRRRGGDARARGTKPTPNLTFSPVQKPRAPSLPPDTTRHTPEEIVIKAGFRTCARARAHAPRATMKISFRARALSNSIKRLLPRRTGPDGDRDGGGAERSRLG